MSLNIPKAVLYYSPASVWSAAVLLALEEKGYSDDEVDRRLVDLAKGENFAPSFLRLNPQATVPTIVVPLEKTLSSDVESRYRSITDSQKIIEFLDKSRSFLSKTHTISASPAPSLAPATIAFASQSSVILDILHSDAADPNRLALLNAHDDASLQSLATATLPYLQGRQDALTQYLSESESETVHFSEKTKAFWKEKKLSNEAMLGVMRNAAKNSSDLDGKEKSEREAYFSSAKAAWEASLQEVVLKLNKEIIGPFALGEQLSLADLTMAAWFARVLSLCGVRALGTTGSVASLEARTGATLPMDFNAVDAQRKDTARQSKLAAFWEAVSTRPSFGKVYAAGLY